MKHSESIIQFLEENFNEKKMHDLCRKYKFIKRSSSKIQGYEFIQVMIIPSEGVSTDSLKGLCQRLKKLNPKADLSAQALCERINNVSSANLMKAILGELIQQMHETIKKSSKLDFKLEGFNRILIQDSTLITLNEKLEDKYPGTKRGKSIKSQAKIDLIYDLGKGVLVDASLFQGKKNDQSLSNRIIEFLEPNDLLIRDLGYFDIKVFHDIAKAGAFFLSRIKSGVKFYLNKEDEKPLDLEEHLGKKEFNYINIFELEGWLGDDKEPIRLIIYRQTEEVINKRLRIANQQSKKRGRTLSKKQLFLLKFSMFVTNVPKETLKAEMIGTIYRLRWEIELVFKRWKSLLNIDYLKGINQKRIDCLIWSRLCTIVILELITASFRKIAKGISTVELSEVKLIQYLMRGNYFFHALVFNKLESFFNEMEEDILRMLSKDRRRRKTMRERVLENESYYEIKNVNIENVKVA